MSKRGYVPEHTHEALQNYFNNGWEPGSFLMAVLRNDLIEASFRADHINRDNLANIAEWIYHNAPRGSWGSTEVVRDWLQGGVAFQQHQKQRLVDILSTP